MQLWGSYDMIFILNEVAKRKASQLLGFGRPPVAHISSMKLRSVKLRNLVGQIVNGL